MFDLFRSRDKAVRILLGGLLVLVAASMLTYLVPGGYSGGASGRDELVAQIGGEKVTMRDVQLQIAQQMRSRSFPPEMAEFFVPQLIDRMISDRALAFEAERLGFKVTDADLAQAIESIIPQAFEGGKFDKQMYQALLSQQNLTIPEFEANVRTSMLVTRLMNIALEGVVVTPQEVEREFHRRNDKVKLDYMVFPPAKFKSQVTVEPGELAAMYKTRQATYTIPEKRSFEAVLFDQAKAAATLAIPEGEVRAAYQSDLDRFRTPERVKVRHILIKTTEKSPAEVQQLQAKADSLLKQIKAGADFAELAKKNSDDTGSAAKGGDLDWVARGQTVKNFEDTAFSLKPGQISNVIKTEYGFHILQVQERQEARLRPFEEARSELEGDLRKQHLAERLPQLAEQAHAEIVRTPASIEQVAQKMNAQVVKAEAIGQGDAVPEIGVNKEFEQAVFATARGGVSPVVQIGQDKLAFALVTDITPLRQATFAEVEGKIRDLFVDSRAKKLASDVAAEAAARLATGQDFKAVAKSYGLEVKSGGEFNREGAAEGLGSADYLQEAFVKPVGATFGPVTVSENIAVCKIIDKTVADTGKLAAERTDLVFGLKRKKANERSELFQDGILARLMQEKKVKKNEDAIKRLIASYRNQT